MNNVKVPAQVYSRCCGYFSMVKYGDKKGLWNIGKVAEYNDRKYLKYNLRDNDNENISKIL